MPPSTNSAKIAGVILAAGKASRFGSDKRLANFNSSHTLLTKSIELLAECCDDVFIVLKPSDREKIHTLFGEFLNEEKVHAIYSESSALGMGSSLSDAIHYLEVFEKKRHEEYAGILLGLADMPYIKLSSIEAVLASKSAKKISLPYTKLDNNKKKMGHPVWFDRYWFEKLKKLEGDKGGKSIITKNPHALIEVFVEDGGILRDVDEPSDLI